MNAEAEILEAEFREFLRRGDVGVEIVFGQRPALLALAFAVAADEKAARQQHQRRRAHW